MNLGYLDDMTLGGSPGSVTTVAKDISRVVDVGRELVLALNVFKCESVAHDSLDSDSYFSTFFFLAENC